MADEYHTPPDGVYQSPYLPYGWLWAFSSAADDCYYIHPQTDTVQWEYPDGTEGLYFLKWLADELRVDDPPLEAVGVTTDRGLGHGFGRPERPANSKHWWQKNLSDFAVGDFQYRPPPPPPRPQYQSSAKPGRPWYMALSRPEVISTELTHGPKITPFTFGQPVQQQQQEVTLQPRPSGVFITRPSVDAIRPQQQQQQPPPDKPFYAQPQQYTPPLQQHAYHHPSSPQAYPSSPPSHPHPLPAPQYPPSSPPHSYPAPPPAYSPSDMSHSHSPLLQSRPSISYESNQSHLTSRPSISYESNQSHDSLLSSRPSLSYSASNMSHELMTPATSNTHMNQIPQPQPLAMPNPDKYRYNQPVSNQGRW